jgi:hypothetical protein
MHKNEVFTSQPQVAVGIEWGNPLSNGLLSLLADISTNTFSFIGQLSGGSEINTVPSVVTRVGVGAGYRGSSNLDWHAGPVIGLANQLSVTIVALVVRTGSGSSSFSGPFGLGESSPVICLETSSGSFPAAGTYFSAFSSSGARSNLFVPSGAELAPLNTPQVVAIRVGSSLISAFYDGRLIGTAAGPTVLQTFGSLQKGRSNGFRFNGQVPFVSCWNRALSTAEIISVSNNPWQLFRRTPRPIFTPVGESGVLIPDLTSPGVIDITANTAKPELNVQY